MSFETSFQNVVLAEGAETNDPKDSGGETKYGISKGAYPNLDIPNLTLQQAKDIYFSDYWVAAKCNQMPDALAYLVFDSAVNQGVSPTIKMLQKALGTVQDGIIGQNTMTAINKADQSELCALFMAERAMRYYGTRGFDRFGRGWLKRLFVASSRGFTKA